MTDWQHIQITLSQFVLILCNISLCNKGFDATSCQLVAFLLYCNIKARLSCSSYVTICVGIFGNRFQIHDVLAEHKQFM